MASNTYHITYCKHYFSMVNLGLSGCVKGIMECYKTNCPDWEPVELDFLVTTSIEKEEK